MKPNKIKYSISPRTVILTIAGRVLIALPVLFLFGCLGESKPVSDPQKLYWHDLYMKVNGLVSYGYITIPISDQYKIKAMTRNNYDLAVIDTCTRSIRPKKNNSKIFDYTYIPLTRREREGCFMRIGVFSKDNDNHQWGIVFFENPDGYFGQAICGEHQESGTATSCHNIKGKGGEIEFREKVVIGESNCNYQLTTKDNKLFEYVMPPGYCVVTFVSEKNLKIHTHYTVGVESRLPGL